MSFIDEFMEFLSEYNVMGLAIAFVIGVAVKDLVDATVRGIIMPVVGVFLPGGQWQTAVTTIYGVEFEIGIVIAAMLDFVVIAFLIFVFVKYVLRKEKVGKL